MKVNLYVHSKSGNSLFVSNALKNAAISAKHETSLTQIVPEDENQMFS